MPELPEVEALGAFLTQNAAGRRVVDTHIAAMGALKTVEPGLDALVGRTLTGAQRHGKWLAVRLDADAATDAADGAEADDSQDDSPLYLVFHLARAGWLRWQDSMPPAEARTGKPMGRAAGALALRVWLEDGGFDLTEAGTRKSLAVYVVRDPAEVPRIASLGFDPVGLSAEELVPRLRVAAKARNQRIKAALRDQHLIAGIGNAYSDEILHAAKVSPFALTGTMREEELQRIAQAVHDVLAGAIETSRGFPAPALKDAKRRAMAVHGRTGEACPVCGDVVREVAFTDSSMQYCATCQTEGRILADRRLSRLLR